MRANPNNPKRHLWLNNGWWWMRFTPYHPQFTERITINLKTKDLQEAQRRRDAEMDKWARSIVPERRAA